MKRVILVVVLLLAGFGGWWAYSSQGEAADGPPTTVAVTRNTVTETVLATGLVEAKQLVSVAARTSGQIETLAVEVGQSVEAGDLIAQIDSLEQQNAVAQAEADLKEIEAQIEAQDAEIRAAELTMTRQTALQQKQLVTTSELDSAEADLAVAKAQLSALDAQKSRAEIAVASAELDLDRTRVTAPISGTIVAVVVSEGQTVSASQSAPTIVKIAQIDQMLVKAEISEADVVSVATGQQVEFSLLGDSARVFTATLGTIEPAPASIEDSDDVDTTEAIYYNSWFEADNPDGFLRIGMTADVTIILDRAENALVLPVTALPPLNPEGKGFVAVYDSETGSQEMREVEVGLADGVYAEIISGLEEGEQVIASGGTVPSASATQDMGGPPPMMGF